MMITGERVMDIVKQIVLESYMILLDSSIYILGGILLAGLLKVVLQPEFILNHLGKGRYSSVAKAAFFGIPLPL